MRIRSTIVAPSSMALLALVLLAGPASAQNGAILRQALNPANGEGYTVLRVWGTPHEMGYAQGFLLAEPTLALVKDARSHLGAAYAIARTTMAGAVWKPAAVEQELLGIVAGVKAAQPAASVDVDDLRVINTIGDWAYYACRSHSAWGSFVTPPIRTLSTRLLEFDAPVSSLRHHLLIARAPSDGGVRWVSLAWPGMVTSVTGVNEHGTLAALHDYKSNMVIGPHLPRMAAVRHALTLVGQLPVEQHLDAVYAELQKQTIMTGTFLNYYVPEGKGGVITCPSAGPCNKKRVPQPSFFNGEVLLTTNEETDGRTAPDDDSYLEDYYSKSGPKALADHFGLVSHKDLHVLSVGYRGRNDMTLWAEGQTKSGFTPTIMIEWSELFQGAPAPTPSADAGPGTGPGTGPGAGTGPGTGASGQPSADSGGCGLLPSTPRPAAALVALALALLGLLVRARRRGLVA